MQPLVAIAIPDFAGPVVRAKTLAALARHTPEPHEIVLFVDRSLPPDTSIRPGSREVRYLPVSMPFCVPAALNRLLKVSSAPYLLLLESGAIVTETQPPARRIAEYRCGLKRPINQYMLERAAASLAPQENSMVVDAD